MFGDNCTSSEIVDPAVKTTPTVSLSNPSLEVISIKLPWLIPDILYAPLASDTVKLDPLPSLPIKDISAPLIPTPLTACETVPVIPALLRTKPSTLSWVNSVSSSLSVNVSSAGEL